MTETNNATERRLLQFMIAFAALVPVIVGIKGMVMGTDMYGETRAQILMENHFRYLSGILMAIGISFWRLLPTIEKATGQVRMLTYLVVLGGLARLFGTVATGMTTTIVLALLMELVVTPFLCIWQSRVAQRFRRP